MSELLDITVLSNVITSPSPSLSKIDRTRTTPTLIDPFQTKHSASSSSAALNCEFTKQVFVIFAIAIFHSLPFLMILPLSDEWVRPCPRGIDSCQMLSNPGT
jgi:hypothetical protein